MLFHDKRKNTKLDNTEIVNRIKIREEKKREEKIRKCKWVSFNYFNVQQTTIQDKMHSWNFFGLVLLFVGMFINIIGLAFHYRNDLHRLPPEMEKSVKFSYLIIKKS